MNCPKCGLENPSGALFCMRCGRELATDSGPPASETLFCYRHPKEPTQLSCGRCGRPVCTKCVVLGPAGPRCRDCAKQNIPLRPGAVAYEAKRGLMSLFRGGPWTIYMLIIIVGALFSFSRGCFNLFRPQRAPSPEMQIQAPAPTDSRMPREKTQ